MEALWKLEDKWKLSTEEAVGIFACISILVITAICVVVVRAFRTRKTSQKGRVLHHYYQDQQYSGTTSTEAAVCSRRWQSVKKALMGSVRWSGRSRWEDDPGSTLRGSQRETPTRLLVGGNINNTIGGPEMGWQSHNSTSPVWQRPILMGEKCELPKFSGLILYDERGLPTHHTQEPTVIQQEKGVEVKITTLKDLL